MFCCHCKDVTLKCHYNISVPHYWLDAMIIALWSDFPGFASQFLLYALFNCNFSLLGWKLLCFPLSCISWPRPPAQELCFEQFAINSLYCLPLQWGCITNLNHIHFVPNITKLSFHKVVYRSYDRKLTSSLLFRLGGDGCTVEDNNFHVLVRRMISKRTERNYTNNFSNWFII